MSALYLLIPVSLILGAIALGLFLYAGRKGQFDDIEGPKYRMLDDDEDDK
ncbi:MAG: cbb3-type cytochrome oxidase assembly protein CcoS [Geovibrio sp.]|jgi:cbb3-type cytochrome oxidase maturation protein|nr:cbb3-type cytochrome oxidase assembly protein CcoS [Geovibrio ferrireducens]MCD8493499.1 cbb3-type cytochrome oxidase assembly protein CcoS [Geovibrio sp.]MCD8567405.1 cbb3-type cytochrome oxidase assembly protein CcoS [Geovibrio sp.]